MEIVYHIADRFWSDLYANNG